MANYDDLAATIGTQFSGVPPVQLSFAGADGTRLNAFDWGGSGPNCLLLHGGAMSAHTWTQCALLLRRTYRCVSLDLRGHGDSAWSNDYSIPNHVRDILCVLEQLDWSAPHFVGMSLGGVVAAHTVSALKERPPKSLTLVDVAPGVSFGDVDRIRDFMSAEFVKDGPIALTREALRLGAPQSEAELLYRYNALTRPLADGGWTWKHDTRRPTDFAHILENIAQLDSLAPNWRVPCLVVRGGRSRILSEDAARAFATRCLDGHFVSVADAGHSVQEDNPRGLSEKLDAFWSTLSYQN